MSELLALIRRTLQDQNELDKRKEKNLSKTVEPMSKSCDTVCRLERRDEAAVPHGEGTTK